MLKRLASALAPALLFAAALDIAFRLAGVGAACPAAVDALGEVP